MPRMGQETQFLAIVLVGLAVAHPAVAAERVFSTVALSGQPAYGLGADVTYSTFGFAAIGNSGHVGFRGTFTGPGVTSANNAGIWAGPFHQPVLLARRGGPTGEAGFIYSDFLGEPTLYGDGRAAFNAKLDTPTTPTYGLYSGRYAAPQLVVRGEVQAPDEPPFVRFSAVTSGSVNDDGVHAFAGSVYGPGIDGYLNSAGIWIGPIGQLQRVAAAGTPAPSTGVNFGSSIAADINADGRVAFLNSLAGPGTSDANNRAIFVGGRDDMTLVARTGDAAAGFPGASYSLLVPPQRSSSGHVVFAGQLAGGGMTKYEDAVIWSGQPGSLAPLAREGTQAPGAPDGAVFGDFVFAGDFPEISRSTEVVAFGAQLRVGNGITDHNKSGIWAGTAATGVQLIARSGDPAPGMGGDLTMSVFAYPVVTGQGQVVFRATLNGPGINVDNERSLWLADADEGWTPRLLARGGDTLNVGNGDLRTFSWFGHPSANDAGDLAFDVIFTDGSRGVLTTVVPEPSGCLIVLIGAAVLRMPRSRLAVGTPRGRAQREDEKKGT